MSKPPPFGKVSVSQAEAMLETLSITERARYGPKSLLAGRSNANALKFVDPRSLAILEYSQNGTRRALSNKGGKEKGSFAQSKHGRTAIYSNESAVPTEIQDGLKALLDKSKALDQSLKSFLPAPYYNHAASPKSHAVAARTFSTGELLVMILRHLDQASMSDAQAVCCAWSNAVERSETLSKIQYKLFPAPPGFFRILPATHTPKGVSTSIRFHAAKPAPTAEIKVLSLWQTSIIVQLTDKVHRIPRFLNAGRQKLLISENPVVKSMQIWKSCSKARHEIVPADMYFPRLYTTDGKLSPGPPSILTTLTTSSHWASPLLQRILHDKDWYYLHPRFSERSPRPESQRDGYVLEEYDTIANDKGLTLGDLYDATNKISAAHSKDCPYEAEHEHDPATGNVLMDFRFIGTVSLADSTWARETKSQWDSENRRAYNTDPNTTGRYPACYPDSERPWWTR
ncbi:hypothetical protein BST61_g9659 [Cercospora zeina]